MGEGRKKKIRFLEKHPLCCFCGGSTPATTIDHIPSRTCFRGRAYPEGFEFPACVRCQDASRQDELAFAFWVQMLNQNQQEFDPIAFSKMLNGIKNNLPHFIPKVRLTANEIRRRMRWNGQTLPRGMTYAEFPMIDFTPDCMEAVLRVACKLGCAIYYKEKGQIISNEHIIHAVYSDFTNGNFGIFSKKWLDFAPLKTVGTRSNINFGDQFSYNFFSGEQTDLLLVLIGFGKGAALFLTMIGPEFQGKVPFPPYLSNPMKLTEVASIYPK